MIAPSQVATPADIQALIDDPSTDDLARQALAAQLVTAQRLAAGADPFRGVVMADPRFDEAM